MYCVDASVLLSAARGTERYSAQSRAFFDDVRGNRRQIFLPEIALGELASGLFRATDDASYVREYLSTLSALPNISFVAIDRNLSALSIDIILGTKLRAADALYVALALDYRLTLVSLDREQLQKAERFIAVQEP